MTIAVYGNMFQKHSLPGLHRYLEVAHGYGRLAVEAQFYDFLHENLNNLPRMERVDTIPSDTSLLISFGGDGTFLRAAQWANRLPVHIMGVNTGHLGYLAMYDIEDPECLAKHFSQPFTAEQRTVLEISGKGLPTGIWPYALNEVSILKQNLASMVNVRATVDDIYLTDYLGDGLIVSTATGSTGYNLSVGGPVLQPDSSALILSPIAPHTLTMRPLIVDRIETITALTTSRAPMFTISLDGQSFDMPQGSEIEIRRAPFFVYAVRPHDDDFAQTLRTKLLWGRR